MKRVMIIGNAGSGKSTLSRKLGELTGLPVVHGDHFQWMENWTARPEGERDAMFLRAVEKPEWIIDGNYFSTMEVRANRADTILFLDFPKVLCLWRVIRRSVRHYGKTRPDMPEGCKERLNWEFVKWIWSYDRRARPKVLKLLNSAPLRAKSTVFSHKADVDAYLQSVSCGQE